MAKKIVAEERMSPLNMKSMLTQIINSKFSNKVAYELGKASPTDVKDWIPTGSTLLNYICGNRRDGGIPVGKLIEIVGLESTGKSLLCQHIAANAQKSGGFVAYIDTESAVNADFMKRVGVNIDELFYAQPGTLEEVFETQEEIMKQIRSIDRDRLIVLIWDSVAGTATKGEINGTFNPSEAVGEAARIISKAMRKLIKEVGRNNISMIFTNQLRAKIGGISFGDPMTATYGGKAIPYYSSLRIKLTRKQMVKKLDNVIGIGCEAKIIKNRVAPPFRTCQFDILFDHGIDESGSILNFLKENKIVTTSGSWHTIVIDGNDKKFSGRKGWDDLWADKQFQRSCYDIIDDILIIKYDDSDADKLKHLDIDAESELEMKELVEELKQVHENDN